MVDGLGIVGSLPNVSFLTEMNNGGGVRHNMTQSSMKQKDDVLVPLATTVGLYGC